MVPLHAADLPCPIAAVIGSSHWRAVAMLSSVDSQEQGQMFMHAPVVRGVGDMRLGYGGEV
jgi:hypothetical protein